MENYKKALEEASRWEEQLTEKERNSVAYSKARKKALKRIYDKYFNKEGISQVFEFEDTLDELVTLAKKEYGEFEREFLSFLVYKNGNSLEIKDIETLKKTFPEITNENIQKLKDKEHFFYVCEDNYTVISVRYGIKNKGWKYNLVRILQKYGE